MNERTVVSKWLIRGRRPRAAMERCEFTLTKDGLGAKRIAFSLHSFFSTRRRIEAQLQLYITVSLHTSVFDVPTDRDVPVAHVTW